MSLANAFFCVMAFIGVCFIAWCVGSFLRFDAHHRRIARHARRDRGYMRVIGLPQADERAWQRKFEQELRR